MRAAAPAAAWAVRVAAALAVPPAARAAPVADGLEGLARPVVEGRWLRPAAGERAIAAWGHAEGLRVGLHPLPGPRGMLRVYAPYLSQPETRMINFIAIEPTVVGKRRGLSELEPSRLDGVPGKRLWSGDDAAGLADRRAARPARGVVRTIGGIECLQVFIGVERFDNGARPLVRLTFRADRPHAVGLATFAAPGSAAMTSCVLTATMGNYARLRRLALADGVVTAAQLWPGFTGDGFARRVAFPLGRLPRLPDGSVLVSAVSDEADPARADAPKAWRYVGRPAVQAWRCERPEPGLEAAVNARARYWRREEPIPGGPAIENFELAWPFRDGQEVWFVVEPLEAGR